VLKARVRELAILDFEVPIELLAPRVPGGTEVDLHGGRALVSVLGMLFGSVRVYGVPLPFAGEFAEINVRFYVRRRAAGQERHGVVFLRELVPRRLVAAGARVLYRERYAVVPTRHAIERSPAGETERVSSGWTAGGRESGFELGVEGPAEPPRDGSEEAFVVDRPWGYTRRGPRRTVEFAVGHPLWSVRRASVVGMRGGFEDVLPRDLAAALAGPPSHAFLVLGSDLTVGRPSRVEI
jgi:uncharacterized protein YqjF (DUF2071 family)